MRRPGRSSPLMPFSAPLGAQAAAAATAGSARGRPQWSPGRRDRRRLPPARAGFAMRAPGLRTRTGRQGGGPPPNLPAPINFTNQTLRQIVHASLGGERIRVVLSNAFGSAPLAVGAAHVALRTKDAAIDSKSDRALTFGGSPSVHIAAGAVGRQRSGEPPGARVRGSGDRRVPARRHGRIAVAADDARGGAADELRVHRRQSRRCGGPAGGDDDRRRGSSSRASRWRRRIRRAPWWRSAIRLPTARGPRPNTNSRWPDVLARRLAASNDEDGRAQPGHRRQPRACATAPGVSALARFDRDVLVQPGVTHVIVLESINDIGIGRQQPVAERGRSDRRAPAADRAGARARAADYGATLTPFEGAAYATPEGEAKRQAVNEWIRTGKALRRRDRLRRGRPRSGRAGEDPAAVTTPATTCT